MSFAPEIREHHLEQEEDVLALLLKFLRDKESGALGGRVVYVDCPIFELSRRLKLLLPAKLNRKEAEEARGAGFGFVIHNMNAVVFFPALNIDRYNLSNVTDIVRYHPKFWKDEQQANNPRQDE